jgi:hypothetical protein
MEHSAWRNFKKLNTFSSVEGGELKADPPNQLETRWSFRKGTQNKRRSESLLLGKRASKQ